VFILLIVLAESFPIAIGAGRADITTAGIVYWAMIVLFTPFWATTCAVSGFLFTDIFVRRRPLQKAVFNTTQIGVSVIGASLALGAIRGAPGLSANPKFFIGFLAAIAIFWFLNTWLVSLAIHFWYGESTQRFWRRNYQWAWVYELSSAPIALVVAFAYDRLTIVGLILVTLPTLMVRLAYSQYLDLKRTYNETVRTMVKIIEMHDPYTAGHSDRVANYARRLCVALNVSPAKTERIELAAYLHDLGKINLDLTGIVRKAGKLTEEERRLIRMHPVMSADLANQVSYFKGEIEEMIRHHHENWDGSGYPHGLRGEEIPFGARIILLADAFDAMTTSRVYREALDIEFVKEEFRKFAGIQFDPELVPVFLDKVVKDGSEIISKPIDEPLEGQRARAPEVVAHQPEIRSIPRSSGL
jgi:HD-GYP domain-containing protein (c-di-GMP phosphodiesterase class II)